ncbi:peptide ABC transporter permease [Alicyclobacillus contaminans]|uniref:ABC transporter permease n=1 Tax=Alicyclobacillus contaminans TaxID=392016 RepID=UPI0004108234|nr:ABC transporter permease [Alicyclobacillus contaminans]GMA51120.1 peptide ABC transporter permease [Alicyclobacillus contaminans]
MNNAVLEPSLSPAAGTAVKRRMSFWRFARRYPSVVVGGLIVLIMVLIALFAPVLAHYDPTRPLSDGLSQMGAPLPPNHKYWLGTDTEGRDVFSRVLYGARVSLEVGFFAGLISLFIGALLGIISGYFGGWVDMVIMRLTDMVLAFPFLLFVVALVAVMKPSVTNVFIAIGVFGWAQMARIIRGQVLAVKELEYVQAARSLGASAWNIIFKEVLPNVITPVVIYLTLAIGQNILLEASLSFLGFGVQPPEPSWGNMIQEGMAYFQLAPWLIYAPGLMLLITTIGFNLLGDGLRDWLDPKVGR